jgi:hypothetical protein
MIELPADKPETTPVAGFTEAADELLLLQLPPPTPVLNKVVVEPMHTEEVPPTVPALEIGLTLIT